MYFNVSDSEGVVHEDIKNEDGNPQYQYFYSEPQSSKSIIHILIYVCRSTFPFPDSKTLFISRRALAREGDYEMMPVCVCVRACVCACIS